MDLKQSGNKQSFVTGSQRDSRDGKGRYDLISPIALRRLAVLLEKGAVHYGERNWEKGQPLMRFLDSALRHLFKHIEGMRDEDHLAAAMWNIHCVLHIEEKIAQKGLPETLDDRPKEQYNYNACTPLIPASFIPPDGMTLYSEEPVDTHNSRIRKVD